MRHQLAELLPRRLGDPHVVAERLRHLVDAVEALEQRRGEHDLGLLAVLLLEVAAHEVVEELVGAAELDVGLRPSRSPSPGAAGRGTPSARWRRLGVAAREVVALEHAGDGGAAR